MIKPLLITSLCAFLASAGFFSLAAASGVAHGGGGFWRAFDGSSWEDRPSDDGPIISRNLTWTGGDKLDVAVGADVQYTQGPVASIVATGRKGTVDNLIVSEGEIRFDHRMRHTGDLKIVMTAPDVKRFTLMGSHDLTIAGYKQDTLEVSLAGSGDVNVKGETRHLDLNIAGSGDVDASDLKLADAKVNIAGSGNATVGPTNSADVSIAGSGDVELTTNPAALKSRVMGSGSVTTH